jgi:four helix bundle protein
MGSNFRVLAAYRLAAELADDVHRIVGGFPPIDQWTLGVQLIRAVDSVGANIAESTGRWRTPDRRRLLLIARGSLLETEHWLIRGEARGLIEAGTSDRIQEIA